MSTPLEEIFQSGAMAPADCLLAAAQAGWFVAEQPTALADELAIKRYLQQHLAPRSYRIRQAEVADLPVLLTLETQCWPAPLRTAEDVLAQRVARYPQGQLVLLVENAVVGVIYSQLISAPTALEGIAATRVDNLHDPAGTVVQLLAVNVLPQMQQHNLGDQLLEFMLTYRSLQAQVQTVVAITLCKHFDAAAGINMDDYIRVRNQHGTLADPILRFHELHGATIERVMPGYRPADLKNLGNGVLVSYDIHRRTRRTLQLDPAAAVATIESTDRAAILQHLQQLMQSCLPAAQRSALACDRPLMEMGLDSADLLMLNETLAQHYRLALNPTFFFRCNTIDKIADYLCSRSDLSSTPDMPATHATAHGKDAVVHPAAIDQHAAALRPQDVAIIGMACRLPGAIDTPQAFWECLQAGTSLVGKLPAERWQWPQDIDPAQRHQGIDRGAFLQDVAAFDAPFFRISPAEAESMDPQQRLLLELSWQAIEHAGYAPAALSGSATGVFIGASGADYARLLERSELPLDAHYGTGSSMAVLANRLSYYYDFTGPSLLIDTACSSSLVALHQAVQSLQRGEVEQALVGGVNLILHPANSIAYYKAGMLARDGLCKTFDDSANGYVRSEGALMFLLKPAAAALADGDCIHAIIKGSASNHGGQSGGLTVPNPAQQARLLQAAWNAAGIDPLALGYIEAHGTGTALGDPLEVQGLAQAFATIAGVATTQHPCSLGSVKTNLGHLEAAAGLAGLLKTVLCLQHGRIPANLHFQQLNRHIELAGTHLQVVTQLQDWPAPGSGAPRLAGVSSFGSGGANAHVVLAEYLPAAVAADHAAPEHTTSSCLFVLSARTRPQLLAYARNYLAWLQQKESAAISLAALTHQLQRGRQAMAERLAWVVDSRAGLVQKLRAFCASQTQPAVATDGQFRPPLATDEAAREEIRLLTTHGDLERLASLWQAGASIDWSLLPASASKPARIVAPTYPFARHRYWLPHAPVVPAPPASAAALPVPLMLAPLWRAVAVEAGGAGEEITLVTDGVLFAGDLSEPAFAALAGVVPEQLQHIVWIAPAASDLDLAAQQEHGLLALFRLVKTLLAQGYGERDLRWTVVTRGTQAVFAGAALAPAHAGVHGLTGVLAKEYPRWSICALDLEPATTLTAAGMAALMRIQIPAQARGDVLAQRNGQWFRRVLAPVTALPPAPPAYRQRGVYVVIGGAGGIGAAWTRHVMSEYDAQVVWIGRRAPDAALTAQLQALAGIGTVPLYVQADATDAASLQRARDQIRQSYQVIHGVIHCAVGQFDHSLADMDEQRFRDIVAVKIDASVNLAQVFGTQALAQTLDFMLYFSSIVALEKNGGHSGYAAGGAFEDAYAMQLAQQSPFPVKVINWGHWDAGTGLRIADAAKTRLQQSGRLPLPPAQALAALQQLLGASLVQTAVLNTSRADLLPLYDGTQELQVYPPTLPPAQTLTVAPSDAGELAQLQSHSLFGNPAMEAALLPLLAGTLAALDADASVRPERAPAFYTKWLAASRELVQQAQQQGVLPVELAAPEVLWQDWERARRASFGSADMNAACALAEACLRAVPAILSGTVRATDVLFPDASMRMVEGIYRANAVADYFNRILAESVVAAIDARLRQDPAARLRLLEIGAGTGGTTALLLPYLAPYREHIEQYAYTDLSKAFLFHAETHFVPDYPFVVPLRFDVEQPLAGQAIAAASYDLVIATNVLHATQDIRRTLANAKAALRKDGCLLLNEISDRSVFAHLTFGLLEGWWLSQDQPLRMKDAPGLYPQAWREVLTQEGFRQIAFPAQQAHVLGQQVIVAVSDGVVRQQTVVAPVAPAVATAPSLPPPTRQSPAPVTATDDAALKAAASAHLKKVIATCLRMDSQQIDVREPLASYGLDSILIVQITNALRSDFPEVAATLLFECHTVDALAQHLLQRHQAALRATVGMAPVAANPAAVMAAVAAPAATTAMDVLADHDAIAVIGMSCRFPQARNSEEYWRLLAAGGNAVGEVPAGRWNMQGFFHGEPDEAVAQGKSYSKWGGFLDNVTEFDPLFFNISPKEALSMDPQERLFLQTAWETLEDAGYTRDRVARDFGQQLGVFAGITRTGFDLFGPQLWQQGSTLYPHTSFSSVANRVSYFLNARGPSVPVDTMCSSSLTAIHQASQSLRSGECRLAIAGGVNLYLHPSGYVGLSASRMLSRDGVCRSFGRGGNGFVPGEGVGAVLLKPLAQAQADNDRIYAVIRATHVNHGGKTNGYTVPNPQAQGELVSAALRKAGVSARAVSYIEAHGTGTELGDPIEVAGLVQAFREHTDDVGFCALGSAKSNIGHLEAAAGIAGLIKVILQLQHGQLVPTLHAAETNPNIDFARTPFVLQQSLAPWQRPLLPDTAHAGSRIAGVSSFGAGGANAHVVLEEYPAPAIPAHSHDQADGQDCLIVLSARNAERLQAYAERLHAFVGQVTAADAALPALADLAYTLQVGREQMEARLALVARTWPQLREQLRNWLNRQAQDPAALQEDAGIFHGQARQYRDMIAAFAGDDAILPTLQNWFRQGQHGRLLNLWSKGLSIDWESLYPSGHARRRIAAPTYPFAATSYWLPLEDIAAAPVSVTAIPAAPVQMPVPSPAPALLQSPPILAAISEPVPAKPSAIRLLAPAALPATFRPVSTARVQHHLRPLLSASTPTPAVAVPVSQLLPKLGLYDEGDGVVALRLLNVDEHDMMLEEMAAASALSAALASLQNWPSPVAPRVLLLSGLDQLFGARCRNVATAVAAISACGVPVVAVLSGCNGVAAMTVAAACELVVCSSEGRYSDPAAGALLDGRGLRGAGYTWPLVAPDQLERYARDAAERIAQAGAPALVALKAHLAAGFAVTAENAVLPPLTESGDAPDDEYWEPVALASSVVTLKRNRHGVVLVSLCERSSKNTFSPAFVEGVIAAFEHISSVPDYKVVVLTGYDNYFACGGTREGLLAIQSGRARFTDEQSYRMPLSCEIPVIAAMQGHAIGAGWTMGLFCDWAVYSEESTYQSPYMLYGFTPGAGSTLIFPQRLGRALSHEILLTARPFLGRELQQRTSAMPVLPRSAVLPYALALAEQLAQSDRNQLIAQKSARSAALRQLLPQVFAQELALHDRTFVNNPDVIANIARHFTEAAAEIPAVSTTAASTSESGGPALLESLRASLIEELQLQREQFDDDATFIDLGLDSISAVTWVRKINRQFNLTLGATRVYSYPTLRQFAAFVQTQLPQPMAAPATVPVSAPAAAQSRLHSEELLAWLRVALARELQLEPQALDDDMKFIDLGLDSITAVTWVRGINRHYGLEIGATKVYSYPCLTEFHRYVLELLETAPAEAAEAAEAIAPIIAAQADDAPHATVLVATFALAGADAAMTAAATPVSASTVSIPLAAPESVAAPAATDPARHGIAIIGMSGQFPKADNVAQFWRNIMDGRDCVSEIPATRWPLEQFYDPDRNAEGKTVCRSMGLLETRDEFDPLFFNISPSEAEYMDPQQRLFLQNSWRCIEDAGYDPGALSGSLCGVFVGCAAGDYSQLMTAPEQTHSAQGLMGESVAILPARIAYFLNLQGPCLAIDTACSSSLVALASACDSLVLGHSEVALAGGVYVINGPDIHVKMSKAGMLSPDGRCYSFDQRANGFVPGEGVGVLMLKRLDHATRDGDDIYGVIRGWGVNQDGKTNGITAPNAQSQTRLEAGIYRRFDINPEHIGLIEAHGTGTKLGDPIEVDALCSTFRQFTARKQFCALGSVKSNIGHLANAAGVTGVIKAVLALQHRSLPPTINYRSLNEHIALQDSPFFVNAERREWLAEAGQPRLVAVSSFGFSGTNGHMVLAEAEQDMHRVAGAAGPLVLPLAARNRQQLQAYAQVLSDYLAADDLAADVLADLMHTFQFGRAAMAHRLVVIAATREQLQARLARYALDGLDDDACISGVALKKAIAPAAPVPGQLPAAAELAARWVSGAAVDWRLLYPASTPGRRRHGMPTYPFARERYWIPAAEPVQTAAQPAPTTTVATAPSTPVAPIAASTAAAVWSAPAAAFDAAAWRADALAAGVDWSSRLRHWQQRQLLVLHADSTSQQVFSGLLSALQQRAGQEPFTPCYADLQQLTATPLPARPGVVLVMAGGAQAATGQVLAACRHIFNAQAQGSAPDLVLSFGSSAGDAQRLAEELLAMTAPAYLRCLLLSQDQQAADTDVSVQRLCQEWLAWDGAGLQQVHYAGTRRLVPLASTPRTQAPAMHLIERQWQLQVPLPQAEPGVRGEVLVLVNHESLPLARKLLQAGDFSRIVLVADASVQPNQIQNAIDFSDAKSARMSAQLLTDQYDAITHVIDLSDLYDTPREHDADKLGKMVFYQTLAGTANDLTILYCTKGLHAWQSPQMSLAGAKFAGLVKMLSADYRHIDARCIDIDQQACDQPQELRRILLQECAAQLQQTELCYRQGQRYAPMLALHESTPAAASVPALTIDPQGVYVISGGTNGVGLELAKYLTRSGCRKLVLMGATPLPPRSQWEHALNDADSGLSPYLRNKLPELMALDRQLDVLEIHTGSLSDEADLQRYFRLIRNRDGDIRGVIHCAGRYSDADTPAFAAKDPEHMQQVLEPKIKGLENLHAVLHHDALDFFVALSSMTGVLPHLARGAGDYATANAFVDFFMAYQHEQQQYRQGRQRPCLYRSIVWSDWNQTGAITRISPEKAAAVGQTFEALGMRTFSNREGQALFALAMQAQTGSRACVAYVDQARFGSVCSRLLDAHLQTAPAAPVKTSQRSAAPNLPVPAFLHHLDRWEAEKRAGLEMSVQKLTEVIKLEQIRDLDAALIHRIHKLLFAGSSQLPAAQTGQALPAVAASPQGQGDELAQLISQTVMEVLKLKSIDTTASFQDYGLDSISAMVLATRLEKRLQQQVQPQWLIDYATVTALTGYLASQRSRTA